MPVVERVRGRGLVRDFGRFDVGDRVEVSDAEADYLCGENGDFVRVDEGGDEPEAEHLIDDGVCPWCDEYTGDSVAQHASSAHPDEWNDHTED